MDYEMLLKEFRDTVTSAISTGNQQVSQKLDNVLTRLGEMEKSIIQLDNHNHTSSEKITDLLARYNALESRLKDTEKQILTMQVQGQGISKVGTALYGIVSSIIVGVILWFITKK